MAAGLGGRDEAVHGAGGGPQFGAADAEAVRGGQAEDAAGGRRLCRHRPAALLGGCGAEAAYGAATGGRALASGLGGLKPASEAKSGDLQRAANQARAGRLTQHKSAPAELRRRIISEESSLLLHSSAVSIFFMLFSRLSPAPASRRRVFDSPRQPCLSQPPSPLHLPPTSSSTGTTARRGSISITVGWSQRHMSSSSTTSPATFNTAPSPVSYWISSTVPSGRMSISRTLPVFSLPRTRSSRSPSSRAVSNITSGNFSFATAMISGGNTSAGAFLRLRLPAAGQGRPTGRPAGRKRLRIKSPRWRWFRPPAGREGLEGV